jgi:hypothetical protein
MPVEIRELIIKTEISATGRNDPHGIKIKDLNALKKQLLNECKRLIAEHSKKNEYKR